MKVAVFALLFVSLTVALGFAGLKWWEGNPIQVEDQVLLEFPKGTSVRTLAENLGRSRLVSNEQAFLAYVRFFCDYRSFKAGTYPFAGFVSPKHLCDRFEEGSKWEPIVAQYTIPEGFTLYQIAARLAARGIGTIETVQKWARNPEFLRELGVKAKSLEGYLYPARYEFRGELPSPQKALQVMNAEFFKRLPENYLSAIKAKKLTLHEAVTFASLIEKETSIDAERPMIAEVIWNRIKNRDFLGIDAAVIYGIKDYDGNIRTRHLQDKKNPYNTRVHRGLPPGPIGAPSIASLEALLNPSNMGNYYFVALADGSGRHHFSKTLAEHNRYVRKLVEATKSR